MPNTQKAQSGQVRPEYLARYLWGTGRKEKKKKKGRKERKKLVVKPIEIVCGLGDVQRMTII
jgi:hypothetical protein